MTKLVLDTIRAPFLKGRVPGERLALQMYLVVEGVVTMDGDDELISFDVKSVREVDCDQNWTVSPVGIVDPGGARVC